MIKVGDEKFGPPLTKNWFLAKNPKSAQNSTKSDFFLKKREVKPSKYAKNSTIILFLFANKQI